jgi:hypothetical protein
MKHRTKTGLIAAGMLVFGSLWSFADPMSPVVAEEITLRGTVDKISPIRNEIKVISSDGTAVSLHTNPNTIPLTDIKKGDLVDARYLESVAISLQAVGKPKGSTPAAVSQTVEVTPAASQGATPSETVMVHIADVMAQVDSVDQSNRTFTFKNSDGDKVILKAEPDLKGFDQLKIGDHIQARYTESVAIGVQHV